MSVSPGSSTDPMSDDASLVHVRLAMVVQDDRSSAPVDSNVSLPPGGSFDRRSRTSAMLVTLSPHLSLVDLRVDVQTPWWSMMILRFLPSSTSPRLLWLTMVLLDVFLLVLTLFEPLEPLLTTVIPWSLLIETLLLDFLHVFILPDNILSAQRHSLVFTWTRSGHPIIRPSHFLVRE